MYEYKILDIVKVVDGDTVYVNVSLGFFVKFLVKIRFLDLDTPEIFTGSIEEKEKGQLCKRYAADLLNNDLPKKLTTFGKQGKYGRWLGDIIIGSGTEERSFVNEMKIFLNENNMD